MKTLSGAFPTCRRNCCQGVIADRVNYDRVESSMRLSSKYTSSMLDHVILLSFKVFQIKIYKSNCFHKAPSRRGQLLFNTYKLLVFKTTKIKDMNHEYMNYEFNKQPEDLLTHYHAPAAP